MKSNEAFKSLNKLTMSYFRILFILITKFKYLIKVLFSLIFFGHLKKSLYNLI